MKVARGTRSEYREQPCRRACVRADVFSAEPAQQIAGLEVDAGCVVVDYRSTAVRQRPRQSLEPARLLNPSINTRNGGSMIVV